MVDDRYRQILGRSPDAGGRAYWIGVVRAAGGEQRMVASLLGSAEHVAAVTR
ncbi:MAG: DUF4214 domain-containing protein [Iamia sp.]